jgi:hypothetical protein
MGNCSNPEDTYDSEEFTVLNLGSSGLRDTAQPIRYLLEICGLPYDERIFSQEEWEFEIKNLMSLAFPALPFLSDSRMRISGFITILKHLIAISNQKHLQGRSLNEFALIDQALWALEAVGASIARLNASEDFQEEKGAVYEESVQPLIASLTAETFTKRSFFPLTFESVADLVLYELSHWMEGVFP